MSKYLCIVIDCSQLSKKLQYCLFHPSLMPIGYYQIRTQSGHGYSSALGLGPPKLCDGSTLLLRNPAKNDRNLHSPVEIRGGYLTVP